MDFSVQYLSFFVIQTDAPDSDSGKRYKHYQTLDSDDYADSELKSFLDGEFGRIVRRKVERHPATDSAPTKIGRFVVEPGYELDSNPNFNTFQRLRHSEDREQFLGFADELLRLYMDTSAVRGGAFIVVLAKLTKWFDDPILFVLKCDFEPKIARIADERSLISHVEMAISGRSIKSIQYPHMPEEGMLEPGELKIHQASHARYFEDFLRFVDYEKPLPAVMGEQMLGMVQHYMDQKWEQAMLDGHPAEGRAEEEQAFEIWAASDKRDLQERWTHDQVAAATAVMVEHKPDLSVSFKLDDFTIKGKLAEFGVSIHFAKHNGRYIAVIEGDQFQFERGMSPIELLQPPDLTELLDIIGTGGGQADESADGEQSYGGGSSAADSDDAPPW